MGVKQAVYIKGKCRIAMSSSRTARGIGTTLVQAEIPQQPQDELQRN